MKEILSQLDGWCDIKKAEYLRDLVVKEKAQTIVDVGVFEGRSTLALVEGCRSQKSGTVTAVDSWSLRDWAESMREEEKADWPGLELADHLEVFLREVKRNEAWPYLDIRVKSSQSVCPFFSDKSVDVVHLDGNHKKISSLRDAEIWLPKVKKHGIIVIAMSNNEEKKKSVEYIANRCYFKETLDFDACYSTVFRKR